jgi:hypothetical protein
LLLALLVRGASAEPLAACPRQFDATDLMEAVAGGEVAFGNLDAEGFEANHVALLARLACLAVPLSLDEVARVHRMMALHAAFAEPDRIVPALAALLVVEPQHQLPTALVPEGHPLREALGRAGQATRVTDSVPLKELEEGWFEVDGTARRAVPARRAAIVQRLDGQMRVVETRYWWPGDRLGDWAGAGPEPDRPRVDKRPVADAASPRWAARAHVGGAFGRVGARRVEGATQTEALNGWGVRAGIGVEHRLSAKLGVLADGEYQLAVAEPAAALREYVTTPDRADLGAGHAGLALHVGPAVVSVGPSIAYAHVVTSQLAFSDQGAAGVTTWSTSESNIILGGVEAGAALRLVRMGPYALRLEAEGGGLFTADRTCAWADVGLTLGGR